MTAAQNITPETRLSEILAAFPGLAAELERLVPMLGRLRTPVLREAVAAALTVADAARQVARPVGELVDSLRVAVGGSDPVMDRPADALAGPAWAQGRTPVLRLDADELLAAGTHPLPVVQQRLATLGPQEVILITASFVPEPLVQYCRVHGYAAEVTPQHGRYQLAIGVAP